MTHDDAPPRATHGLSRRGVLVAGAATSAALAVAGCTTYRPDSGDEAPAEGAAQPTPGQPTGGQAAGGQATGVELGPADGVPVGGGTVFKQQKVVVTQPEAGTFKAFGATCPHQGCSVGEVAGGTINCPCHGSKFNISDGSVVQGPAKKGLPAKQVTADGGALKVT